jgi:hypothetical protein
MKDWPRVALGLGVEKLTAQLTADQRGALTVFESMGFRGEALLRDRHTRALGFGCPPNQAAAGAGQPSF